MKIGTLIILAVVVFGGVILIGSFKTSNVVREDVFEGTITNMNLEPMILEGTGVYDRTCKMVENGLTQCDAGIQTEKGLLNFNYKHNMATQGCIDNGQNLQVEILEGGEAIVRRK